MKKSIKICRKIELMSENERQVNLNAVQIVHIEGLEIRSK